MGKPKPTIAGHGRSKDGEVWPVLDGKTIFRLMDSRGIPLDIIEEILEKEKCAFDILGFCRAVLSSPNMSFKALKSMLTARCISDKHRLALDRVFLLMEREFPERTKPKPKGRIF